ncbi:MAG: tRNA epoxyqueuosine(34) reductase QueG [Burkholderiaceae bacterium]
MAPDPRRLPDRADLAGWAAELGFAHFGIADVAGLDLSEGLQRWLADGCHGEMAWMARDPGQRARPAALVPGTVSALMVGADYAPADPRWVEQGWQALADPQRAYVSVYARGRDYHRRVRPRLQQLADRIATAIGPFGYRAFCDSAPVMEVALATRAGLGWRGKHTLALNRRQGSMFFLGTLYTDLPLAGDAPAEPHCGNCTRCLDICPTNAFPAPGRLDARRCISYLTIEHAGPIPVELRPLIGNRIYGCDDCQLACPWNKFATAPDHPDFDPRHGLDQAGLLALFDWTPEAFDERTRGSAIRRIGFERWQRNLAVALGNLDPATAPPELLVLARQRLQARLADATPLLAEHLHWAIGRLGR